MESDLDKNITEAVSFIRWSQRFHNVNNFVLFTLKMSLIEPFSKVLTSFLQQCAFSVVLEPSASHVNVTLRHAALLRTVSVDVELPQELSKRKKEIEEKYAAEQARFGFKKFGDKCPKCDTLHCGLCGQYHLSERCPARGRECEKCGGYDHFKYRCPDSNIKQ
jgi:hypothetical protein